MKKYKTYIIVLLFGLVLIGIGIVIAVNSANFEKNGIKTNVSGHTFHKCEILWEKGGVLLWKSIPEL